MKKLLMFLCAMALSIGLMGQANADTLFWDEFLDGASYTYTGGTEILIMTGDTIYNPYWSGSGTFNSGGAGTTIHWIFNANLSSFEGDWTEDWGSAGLPSFRFGLFDNFMYVNTGTNDLGQSIGEYEAEWSSVDTGSPLNPPGPWFSIGEITRTSYSGSGASYESAGTLTGAVGNVPVPEPATMLLLGSGLVGLAFLGRKKLFKKA